MTKPTRNAVLIAAAPDLLAACKLALRQLTTWRHHYVDDDTNELTHAEIDLKKAITKAEGKRSRK